MAELEERFESQREEKTWESARLQEKEGKGKNRSGKEEIQLSFHAGWGLCKI